MLAHDGQGLVVADPVEHHVTKLLHLLQGAVEVAVVHQHLEIRKHWKTLKQYCSEIWKNKWD